MPENWKTMASATGRYYVSVLVEALRSTFSHANKQGVFLGLVLSVLAAWINAVREDNVRAWPIVTATLMAAGAVGLAWFAAQLILTPVRFHKKQADLIAELQQLQEISARFSSPHANVLQVLIDFDEGYDLSDALINATFPLVVRRVYSSDRVGEPNHSGYLSREEADGYWLWVYEGSRFRARATVRYWFYVEIPEDVEAGEMTFTILHQDLPQQHWRASFDLDDSEVGPAIRRSR